MLNKENTVLVVIDLQEKFVPVIAEIDSVKQNIKKLVDACKVLNFSIIFTEQYSKGLGKTILETTNDPIEKICFDCFKENEFLERIKGFKNLIITGIEAHVCVLQTAISAVKKGFNAYLVVDALSSRKKVDKEIALERAKQEGIKLATTEMAIFQMIEKAGTPEFKEISNIVK